MGGALWYDGYPSDDPRWVIQLASHPEAPLGC
jgi:hypothetical protein